MVVKHGETQGNRILRLRAWVYVVCTLVVLACMALVIWALYAWGA
jgi:hypothetical protein